jgi:WD40 repeat protein
MTGHAATVTSAAFSPDGQRILTASSDNTARLWNLSGQALVTFGGHTAEVWSAVFSPDGRRVLTASDDATAHQSLIDVDDLLAIAACRVGRGLTHDEIERYAVGTVHFHFEQRQCLPIQS